MTTPLPWLAAALTGVAGCASPRLAGDPARSDGCRPGVPCTVYHLDLTRGAGPEATTVAGNFHRGGWSCAKRDDLLQWYLPAAAGVARGYVEVAVTNWDPANQGYAPGVPDPRTDPKSEFMEIWEACAPGDGMRWKLRAGRGYHPHVKAEIGFPDEPGGVHVKDLEFGDALHVPTWDPKETYVFRLEWDERQFRLSVAGRAFGLAMSDRRILNHAGPIRGVCGLSIGELYARKDSMGCLAGPIFKWVKVVSLSGPPGPAKLGPPRSPHYDHPPAAQAAR
jgi:hypothetical protein